MIEPSRQPSNLRPAGHGPAPMPESLSMASCGSPARPPSAWPPHPGATLQLTESASTSLRPWPLAILACAAARQVLCRM
jgi:hypothetical protein